jgi:hypothetical protein
VESKRFKSVDSVYKKLMIQVHEKPLVLRICQEEGLLERLKEANEKLE